MQCQSHTVRSFSVFRWYWVRKRATANSTENSVTSVSAVWGSTSNDHGMKNGRRQHGIGSTLACLHAGPEQMAHGHRLVHVPQAVAKPTLKGSGESRETQAQKQSSEISWYSGFGWEWESDWGSHRLLGFRK
jgi:hypothetical protein